MTSQPDAPVSPTASMPVRGRLFILSAPSGAGKTTLCKAVRERFPALRYSVSHTTRAPRAEEEEGRDYFFISEDDFKKRIRENTWAEWAEVHGHFYGTSSAFIDRQLSKGRDILLDIDVKGARQILARYPDSITIFILPPTFEALEERLRKRGTDSDDTIIRRLKNAETEIAQKDFYQHVVVNDRLTDAIETLAAIIRNEDGKQQDRKA